MSNSLHPLFAAIALEHFPALAQPAGTHWHDDTHDCDAEGRFSACDDSFDHLFGTQQIRPYRLCEVCGKTSELPEREP